MEATPPPASVQVANAEAARKDGDQNPKGPEVDKVAELEKQLAAAKAERAKIKPVETMPPTPAPKTNPVSGPAPTQPVATPGGTPTPSK